MSDTKLKWWEWLYLPIAIPIAVADYLRELFENKTSIFFAILGLPQSGKTHFMNIVRGEQYVKRQTRFEGEDVFEKRIQIEDKTLIYKRSRDISGHNLEEYPDLIKKADVIYFFFRADYYSKNSSLKNIKEISLTDKEKYGSYRDLVWGYLGSVLRDENAKRKRIFIVATFKKNIRFTSEMSVLSMIKDDACQQFKDVDLDNCLWYITDIDDNHRAEVIDHIKQLISK